MVSRGVPQRVELCVESFHPPGAVSRLETAIDRLRHLERAGRIDEFELVVWGDRIGTTTLAAGTDAAERVCERIADLEEWASANGRTLRPGFDTRETRDMLTDESYTVIDLPSMVLVEYADDAVSYVAPSSDGVRLVSVTDRLDTLTADLDPPTESSIDVGAELRGSAETGRPR